MKHAPLVMDSVGAIGLIEKQEQEKEENLKKIMEFFERAQGTVTNDDIQNLLGISDATATRYLEELEKQGRVKQVGRTGSGVMYERV